MHKVFISYSSKLSDDAWKVCNYLENRGIPCWIAPRNIDPGSSYATQIVNAIRQSAALVLLASEYTNASGHVSNEVSLAFDNRKMIIPFKLQDIEFSDEYLYYLGRKHWIDAFRDFSAGLEALYQTLCSALNTNPLPTQEQKRPESTVAPECRPLVTSTQVEKSQTANDFAAVSRTEIMNTLTQKMNNYSYNLLDRIQTDEERQYFEREAERMFKLTVHVFQHGKRQSCDGGIVYQLVESIKASSPNSSISICGLPGSAKNMLLQLAYFHLASEFVSQTSDLLPCYIAANYFEKDMSSESDSEEHTREQIRTELNDFISYVRIHPEVKPVVFVDGVREHTISGIAPENEIYNVLRQLKKYRRVVSIDVGLVKNKQRLKKIIPILGEQSGWKFQTVSLDITDRQSVLTMIDSIFKMYDVMGIQPEELYQSLSKLKYSEVDIFLIRMVAQELAEQSFNDTFFAVDMYERMALRELDGNEQSLTNVAAAMFEYIFSEKVTTTYQRRLWSLAHKHHTHLEFLIAYHFANCIANDQPGSDRSFFRTMLTSGEGTFFVQMLRKSYSLQEDLFRFITENFEQFDIFQKSNGAYWLGRINYKSLTGNVVAFLQPRFKELQKLVKGNLSSSQENLDHQFLFRSVCTGLLFQGKAAAMDEYLCTVITNDVANAINRGATIEYYGDAYQMAADDTYYLDTDLSLGTHALNALCARVDDSLNQNNGKFSENNLIALTTILQARIQHKTERSLPDLEEYVGRAISFLKLYQKRPQHTSSNKIEYYLLSMLEDFTSFQTSPNFDISKHVYDKYCGIKDVKRQQWVSHCIEDPESVSEHTYSSWLMAMFFLPDDIGNEEYQKREVLDMLLIHDLAEAEIGNQLLPSAEPSNALNAQNEILRKLFVKGTYPQIANLTYYYNIWTGYFNGVNINSRVARDMNTIQTSYSFFEYYTKYPGQFSPDEVLVWIKNQETLCTDIGFKLWNQLIQNNTDFMRILNK